jgi:ABC-type bacteriocin/lantibiotic exporter with double-glycine peptidase domain
MTTNVRIDKKLSRLGGDSLKLRFVILTITVLSLLLAFIFIIYPENLKQRLDSEVFKLTYQFLMLIVLGGGVSLLFSIYSKTRDESIRDKEKRETKKMKKKFYNANSTLTSFKYTMTVKKSDAT